MKPIFLLLTAAMLGLSGTTQAESFAFTDIYYGAGFSVNETDNFDDANGYQVFAGYDFGDTLGPLSLAVEVGYMESGEFDFNARNGNTLFTTEAKGPWASGQLAYPLGKGFKILGRAGYDFGDDDGALLGTGIGYAISQNFTLRLEYIARDVTDSLQLNLVYRLKP